jgi:HK97 family phage portal protein
MGLRQALANYLLKEYKLGGTRTGGLQFVDLQAAPTWGYQSYLKAYGEIGWLYACVNVIAQAVAKVPWHLYEKSADGELNEIAEHPMLDLLDSVNPFQSFYQFLYLGTMYKLLVGEEFWQINFAGQMPAEMWLAPPAYMSVIPDQKNYISHYEFRRSGMDRAVKFTIDEIIHVKTPNPYNEFRGLSPAQALTIDLDSERYAARYQQKLFFNDATPGFVLEYPAENLPPQDVRKELQIEWDERFRGVSNARRTAFLWGAKANTLTMSNKDMDFAALRQFNRDAILGAYHVPRSIIGITEDVNRANADAAQYTFAQYCELRESMNRELVTFFGDNLFLDFENPVPEDKVANITNAVSLYKNGLAKLNEARTMVALDPVDDVEGEEFYKQPAPQMMPGQQQGNNEIPPEKGYRILEISHPKALSLSMRRTGKPTGKPT